MIRSRTFTRSALAAALIGILASLEGPPGRALAAPPATASPPDQGAGPAPPPLAFTERVLANGLHVYALRDPKSSNVAVQVWYRVGSRDDPQSRSGFAHLFEHMMFKATRDMPSEELDRLTEDVGGTNNASTWDDFTNFFEVVPANHLGRLLWAEAERMSSLSVDEANFRSERAVVEEELRQSYLANPYGRLILDLRDASYEIHPYKRSTIGSIGDLDAAQLEDVRAFHDAFYRPSNANLVVVGNFDPAALNAQIDVDFGAIANPSVPVPRVTAVEPPRSGPREMTAYAPGVALPALAMTFAIPDAASRALPALKVLDAVLSGGDSSRLNHDLVYERQIAQSAGSDAGQNRDPSLFMLTLVMASGHALKEGEAALLEEVERVRNGGISAEELSRAKNQLIAAALQERETVEGRGFEIGRALMLEGSAARANSDIQALEAVTAADVQTAARLYLRPELRVLVRYLDEGARPKGVPAGPDIAEHSPKVDAASLPANITAPAPPASLPRSPPAAGPIVEAAPPRLAERTLANGLHVVVAHTSEIPVVTAELTARRGAAADPEGLSGLAAFTADLMSRGAAGRSASDIARAVEGAGGALRADASYDALSLTLTVLTSRLKDTLPILADVAIRPTFAPEEIERLRRQRTDELSVTLTEPGALSEDLVGPLVFGAGAYGQVVGGYPAAVDRIRRPDVVKAYEDAFRPDASVLVLTGDLTPEEGFALAEANFGSWAKPPGPPPAAPALAQARGPQVLAVDLPGAGQASVVLASRSLKRSDPAFYAARALDAVYGGGYSARLNAEVRVKRGLSYGAFSRLDGRDGAGLFAASAQTKNASAADVAELMVKTAESLGEAPLADPELAARKASLIGTYGRTAETGSGLAAIASLDLAHGLPAGEIAAYPRKIEEVTPEAARAEAGALLERSSRVLIVVGDAKTFLPALRAKFPDVKVLPAKGLDFEALRAAGAGGLPRDAGG